MEEYNKNCNEYFTTEKNNKYLVSFYDDEDNQKFILLKHDNKTLWCKYKILCSFNIKRHIIRKASDMIIIEKDIKDYNMNFKTYEDIYELEKYIISDILKYYIGYVFRQTNDNVYFFAIEKIIRF